jgi:hypothetical protein
MKRHALQRRKSARRRKIMFYLNERKHVELRSSPTERKMSCKNKAFPTEMEQKEILWKKSMTMKTEANPVKEKKLSKKKGNKLAIKKLGQQKKKKSYLQESKANRVA